jgi:hypothetical protein
MAEHAKSMFELFSRFESEAARLNQKSDSINDALKDVEERLIKANAGVAAWVGDLTWIGTGMPQWRQAELPPPGLTKALDAEWGERDEDGIRMYTVHQFGFAKVPHTGWRLACREVWYGEDDTRGPDFRFPPLCSVPTAILQASREFRVKALDLLPDLLEELLKATSEKIDAIDEAVNGCKSSS